MFRASQVPGRFRGVFHICRLSLIFLFVWCASPAIPSVGHAWAQPLEAEAKTTDRVVTEKVDHPEGAAIPHKDAQHDNHKPSGLHHNPFEDTDEAGPGKHHDPAPNPIAVLPFVVLLLGIALLPLSHKTAHWWEHNSSKLIVSSGCALVVLLFYGVMYGHGITDHATHQVSQPGFPAVVNVLKNAILAEYVPFIVLLFSLYVISGGINIAGRLEGTAATNTLLLGIGALIASFVGTTGAAMVLIRPVIRANATREYVAHTIVFFIFIVCNTGGCLLPIGDPPLFLGYLAGVPFFWTLQWLTPHWALMNGTLLATYFVWDSVRSRHEKPFDPLTRLNNDPFAIRGAINILLLVGVIACVALLDPSKPVIGTNFTPPNFLRECVMVMLTGLSLGLTSKKIREANSFNYAPIIEVSVLFVGIFVCMQAPIQILNIHGQALGIDQPWKFYWCTGVLSSFLDNAPTYVVFFETAKTVPATSPLLEAVGVGLKELAAISTGAVFMGSMTYIGNGPNLMVKAIAETSNIRMPSFFGYMAYSCAVVLPASILLTLVFFR
jgi:Na+/H+ antiporter NhaD/arsenite permease-like protein